MGTYENQTSLQTSALNKFFIRNKCWIEAVKLDQSKNTSRLVDTKCAVRFPELSIGKSTPIGATIISHVVFDTGPGCIGHLNGDIAFAPLSEKILTKEQFNVYVF